MAFDGQRRLVVIGFGAIGAGLFAYEAQRAGFYAPPLVADVQADLVAATRADEGRCRVNIARSDRVEVARIGPLEAVDPSDPADRTRLVEAIAAADELATALPSVARYRSADESSPHRLMAEGLRRRVSPRPLIVLCAENHRAAASLLEAAVGEALAPGDRPTVLGRARFVDTVIGKMSGVVSDPGEVRERDLATFVSGLPSAVLVEAFDDILVARAGRDALGTLNPGMPVLREVDDLRPFEDAKLLGHNATHALAGFLGSLLGARLVADLVAVPGAMAFLRAAFVEESGRALMARHAGADPLFTPHGYAAYADDLLSRMVNPFLADTIERAARDPRRKLGWDDRLVGLLRLGAAEGVPTPRYAMGVAAGVELLRRDGATGTAEAILRDCWPPDADPDEFAGVVVSVEEGSILLSAWRVGGFAALAPPARGSTGTGGRCGGPRA